MLADLLQIDKRVLQALANSCHATQRRSFELLALEQALAIFEKTDVISSDGFNERLGRGKLTKGDAEMTVYLFSTTFPCRGCPTYSASYSVFSKSRWNG